VSKPILVLSSSAPPPLRPHSKMESLNLRVLFLRLTPDVNFVFVLPWSLIFQHFDLTYPLWTKWHASAHFLLVSRPPGTYAFLRASSSLDRVFPFFPVTFDNHIEMAIVLVQSLAPFPPLLNPTVHLPLAKSFRSPPSTSARVDFGQPPLWASPLWVTVTFFYSLHA